MFKALSLSLIIFATDLAAATPLCRSLFSTVQRIHSVEDALFSQMESLIELVEKYELFESKTKKRNKEIDHIRKDLAGIKGELNQRSTNQEHFRELMQKWESFNNYWLTKAQEFESLPEPKKKKLRQYMDLPLSLAIKHFIAFAEASNHSKWDLGRLNRLLTIHESASGLSLEAALFVFQREVLKFQSKWDFMKCRY